MLLDSIHSEATSNRRYAINVIYTVQRNSEPTYWQATDTFYVVTTVRIPGENPC
jgi:hypothetical protein